MNSTNKKEENIRQKSELKNDLKYVMKNVTLKVKYYLYLFLYWGIIAIGLLLLVFYLSEYTHLGDGLVIVISLVYFFFMFFLNVMYLGGHFKIICQEESIATIIHSISVPYDVDSRLPRYIENHYEVWLIKYQYKRKMYTRMVKIGITDSLKVKRGKFDIRICKYFPKLIYIDKKQKNTENK